MYRSLLRCQPDSIDLTKQRVFFPTSLAYEIHSTMIEIDQFGGAFTEGSGFALNPPFLECSNNELWQRLRTDDRFALLIDYFYRRSHVDPALQSLVQNIVNATITATPNTNQQSASEKRVEIIAKHFLNGHFALDNGLYKEAVLNFGTVVEAMLNTELTSDRFAHLINGSMYSSKIDMHMIREFRNKVHPNLLQNFADVDRSDALNCRFALDRIIIEIIDHTQL